MKKIFIFGVVMLTAMTLALVSCKKDETSVNATTNVSSKSFYQPPQVDDMNAYLKAFKQKMQTRGNNETMDLDEAAWHLSSVANYDFGDVVNDYANFHYDTLYYNINVVDGKVNVSDLNALYTVAASDIESTFENLDLDNKHIRFIGAKISGDGSVIMSILVTYDWIDHQWYFNDPFTLYNVLTQYYGEDTIYYLNDNFPIALVRTLNDLTGHLETVESSSYYVEDRMDSLMYYDYIDPYVGYHEINYYDSRIFVDINPGNIMPFEKLLYYTDSYADLGMGLLGVNQGIIDWSLSDYRHDSYGHTYNTYHVPYVNIGRLCTPQPGQPGHNDD
ncbi:MAG: hypothetical protein K5920_07040 [Bacteroidales bacterium]|nr:hypothetical protein [Bacteroidales bacterium]